MTAWQTVAIRPYICFGSCGKNDRLAANKLASRGGDVCTYLPTAARAVLM
jgi:hypothetical protein